MFEKVIILELTTFFASKAAVYDCTVPCHTTEKLVQFGREMPKKKLPQAVEKMQNIILPQAAGEMGTGVAYLGRQKKIVVAGKTRKLDMLFFH